MEIDDKRKKTSLRFLYISAFLVQAIMGVTGIAVPIYANFLGASLFILGVIGGAGGLMNSFVPLISGVLSDRFRRKVLIMISMFLCSLSCFLYNVADEPAELIPIKMLETTSVATFWPVLEALISDTDEEKLEESLRRFNISWGSAMVIGPMIGGVLISAYSFKVPFSIVLAIATFIGVACPIFVKENQKSSRSVAQKAWKFDKDNSNISTTIALLSIFLFSSLGGMVISLFPAYATNLGIPAYEVGLIILVWGISRVITFYNSTKIETKLSKEGMFLAGSSMLAISSLLIAHSYTTYSFLPCFFIFGLGMGISYSASISSILRRWSSSRGYAAGLFESLIGVGYFLGPLTGGAISIYGSNMPYIFGSIFGFIIFLIQLALNRYFLLHRLGT
ncbi:MAG: MFS transporter [Thermoproteota archaeon]